MRFKRVTEVSGVCVSRRAGGEIWRPAGEVGVGFAMARVAVFVLSAMA